MANLIWDNLQKIKEEGGNKRRRGGDDDEEEIQKYIGSNKNGKSSNGKSSKKTKRK